MNKLLCPSCSSLKIVKRGTRKNKSGTKQRYRCNDCRSTFIEPTGFERMRHDPTIIVRAVHQHIDGFSLFKTKYHLEQHDSVKVTRRTISQWTKKYADFLKSPSSRNTAKAQRKTALR